MEDRKQSRPQPSAGKEEKVLDLTKDMELEDQEKHKIYDLTEGSDIPVVRQPEGQQHVSPPPPPISESETIPDASPESISAAVEPPSQEDVKAPTQMDQTSVSESPPPLVESESSKDDAVSTPQQLKEETFATAEQENIPVREEPVSPVGSASSDDGRLNLEPRKEKAEILDKPEIDPKIEVSATASSPLHDDNEQQEVPEQPTNEEADSTIEDEVDAAFNEVQSKPSLTEPADETKDQLFDTLSGITQMVDDAVRKISDNDSSRTETSLQPSDDHLSPDADEPETGNPDDEDDEIIELTEIVDPSEVLATEESSVDDNDVIELVEIVDPVELKSESLEDEKQTIQNTYIDQDDLEPVISEEEDLYLLDVEEIDVVEETDNSFDDTEDFDTTEIDNLFDSDDQIEEDMAKEPEHTGIDLEDENEEQVILLTDVLHGGPGAKKASADEELKKEAPNDSRISMETEKDAGISDSAATSPTEKKIEELSSRDIETAVEHILNTKYADTIERLVADAVKKAVSRKVESIKRDLPNGDEPPV